MPGIPSGRRGRHGHYRPGHRRPRHRPRHGLCLREGPTHRGLQRHVAGQLLQGTEAKWHRRRDAVQPDRRTAPSRLPDIRRLDSRNGRRRGKNRRRRVSCRAPRRARQIRTRRHRERLPGVAGRRASRAGVRVAGPERACSAHADERRGEGLRIPRRYRLRHPPGAWLRFPPGQPEELGGRHGAGAPRRGYRRRGGPGHDRRGAHADHHLRRRPPPGKARAAGEVGNLQRGPCPGESRRRPVPPHWRGPRGPEVRSRPVHRRPLERCTDEPHGRRSRAVWTHPRPGSGSLK